MQNQFFHSNVPIATESQFYLDRPHIHQLMEKAVQSPLVTVVAGAGYGKTHSVYSFLQNYDAVISWLQFSERDNNGWRFWENFIQAVGVISKDTAKKLTEIGFPRTERQFDRYTAIPQADIDRNRKYVFVYDDFHLIQNPEVLRFLERSLAVPFYRMTSILISRKEPAINMMNMLSKGLLAQITETELRFTQREMIEYFESQNIKLPLNEAAATYQDTEGWAFAIHLMGLSLKNGAAPEHGRYSMKLNIFRLIESEIFENVSRELQKYLVKLSLIEHLPLDLVQEIAGGKELVAEMETISTFIRFDSYLNEFRIHHLLLVYLGRRQNLLSQDEKRDVYEKAAKWCEANDLKMDAFLYYEKAGNYDQLITLVYTLPLLIPEPINKLLFEIFSRAPKELFEKNATAQVTYSRLIISLGRFDEAEVLLRSTIAKFEDTPPSPFKSSLLYRFYSNLGFTLFFTCTFTRIYDFAQYFRKGAFYHVTSDFHTRGPISVMSTTSYLCRVGTSEKGEPEKYIEELAAAVPSMMITLNGFGCGVDDLARAELSFFRMELEGAERYSHQAVHKARTTNQYEIENRALFFLLRIYLAQGNLDKIPDIFRQLTAQLEIPGYLNRKTYHDIVCGWFYAHTGQPEKLASWIKDDFEESDLNTLNHGLETLVKAICQFAEKRYAAALGTLEIIRANRYGAGVFLMGKVERGVLEASCHYQIGDKAQALKVLEETYILAEPNALDMPFIELGKDMRTLAGAALKEKNCAIPRPWLEKIQRNASAYAKKLFLVLETQEGDRGGSVLSPREMAVLTGLSQGLTREELAEDNDISINTVKSVIRSVYNKLGAVNRADAIRIATAQDLLK